MKKIQKLITVPFIVLCTLLPCSLAFAGGSDWITNLTPSANSAIADGNSVITFSVYAYNYTCSLRDSSGYLVTSTDPNYCANNGYGTATPTGQDISGSLIKVSGSGNTLSASTLATNSSGYGSFTLKSTVAETKTVSVTTPPGSVLASTSVSFSAPVSSVPATSNTSTPKPKTTSTSQPSANTTPNVPASPSVGSVMVAGAKVNTGSPVDVSQNQPLVLSGKTIPNGVVTLTIHSTPKTVTTAADKDGNWTYTVTGLEPGSHTIQASVKDPATGQSSAPAQLLAFTVKASPKAVVAATAQPQTKKSSNMPLIVGLIVLLALAAAGWYLWKKKQASPSQNPPLS